MQPCGLCKIAWALLIAGVLLAAVAFARNHLN
jgi:hypothetical protein